MNATPNTLEAPMLTLSATDVAISMALRSGTLRVTREFNARLGNEFWAISDESGLIEVALSEAEAQRRVEEAA